MYSAGVEAESGQCITCKWCDEVDFICPAFPHGIPEEVILNDTIHDEVLPEQYGDKIYEAVDLD